MFLTNTKFNQTAAQKYMAPLQTAVETQLNGTFTLLTLPSYLSLHQNFITAQFVVSIHHLPRFYGICNLTPT
jgi:hypothetical protein